MQALIAVETTGLHRQMRCGTAVDYGSRYLHLDPQKASELLRVGRLLPQYRLLAQVIEEGRLHWSKIREITRVMTPETEAGLIAYARSHKSHEVQRMVACRPRRAAQVTAPVEAAPVAVAAGAAVTGCEASGPAAASGVSSAATRPRTPTSTAPFTAASPEQTDLFGESLPSVPADEPPVKPIEIQYDLRLSPFQWAKHEQAAHRICSRLGFHANRARVHEEMCDIVLSMGERRTQIRYQVYLHVDGITGDGWLDTDRGFLPAPREVVAEALAAGRVKQVHRAKIECAWPNSAYTTLAGSQDGSEAPTDPKAPEPQPFRASDDEHPGKSAVEMPESSDPAPPEPEPVRASEGEHAGPSAEEMPEPPDPAEDTDVGDVPRSRHRRRRKHIPMGVLRQVLEESEGRCVDCGRRVRHQFNHRDEPYSDTPEHDAARMDSRCDRCHAVFHDEDFRRRPHWKEARDRNIARRRARREAAALASDAAT